MTKRVKSIITVMIAMMVGVVFMAATPMEASAAAKKPAKVTVTAAKSVDYNAVKITWKKAKNAKQYQVYRATSKNGKYKKVKTTKSTSWTNKKLTTGKTYYYKVRAVNGKKTGKFSTKKSATPNLNKVSGVSAASASYASCKVTWAKVSGAKKYQIYRSTTNEAGSYKLIKTTTELSYTNKSLATGQKYYYKVRAVRDSNKGTFSTVKSAVPKLNQVMGFDVEGSLNSSSKAAWSKVSGAHGYQLYRATSKSGTYKLVKTVTAANCEDVKLTQNKTYYYKVRAYRTVNEKKVYSAYSAVKSAYIPIAYKVSASGETIVENKVFNKDVTIHGDNGIIKFVNCQFKGDLICISKEGTKVMLLGGTTVAGQCILDNGMKEGTLETSLPKFITQASIDVKTVDCYGAVYVIEGEEGYAKITFNGKEYDTSKCEWYIEVENGTASLVEYVDQEFTVYGVARWWENGKEKLIVVCEY